MFKRISVLVRRPGDDRAYFSARWERHAAPVSALPKVRGYIQNHVEETFGDPGQAAPIEADGFVELLWDRPEDMAAAFASPAARPMVEDEPGFLGHGSGYGLAAAPALRDAPQGGKLIVALVRGDGVDDLASVTGVARALPGVVDLIADEVVSLIQKPGHRPPQPLNALFHLHFDSVEAARVGGERLAGLRSSGYRLAIFRVRTILFV